MSDKHPGREVLLLWSAFRRDGRLPEGGVAAIPDAFCALLRRIYRRRASGRRSVSARHRGERPSPAAQARELWLQTENLWVLWPGFIDALRAAR
ncbi:MAG: hypothetical protein ACLVK4_08140 [Alistipes shahii]|uniref:hypothetical protein n=1 Tax=Alistipes shahii TaxID=328814 RepID=UPI00399CD720